MSPYHTLGAGVVALVALLIACRSQRLDVEDIVRAELERLVHPREISGVSVIRDRQHSRQRSAPRVAFVIGSKLTAFTTATGASLTL